MIIMDDTFEPAIGGINMSMCLWGFDANSMNQWTPHLQVSLAWLRHVHSTLEPRHPHVYLDIYSIKRYQGLGKASHQWGTVPPPGQP